MWFSGTSAFSFRLASNPEQQFTLTFNLLTRNMRTMQVMRHYLEYISREGVYISGYICSEAKLDEFLRQFRYVSGSSFSIRRSKMKHNEMIEEDGGAYRYRPGYLGKGWFRLLLKDP